MNVPPSLTTAHRTVSFSLEDGVEDVRERRELFAQELLRALWRRAWLILATIVVFNLLAVGYLLVATPQFAANAIVEFNFASVQPAAAGAPLQGVEAASLVESAAQVMRSRGVALAVSQALHLDQDPNYVHVSRIAAALDRLREKLNLRAWPAASSPSELAASELLRRVSVSHEAHTYLISIQATGDTSGQAAEIANMIAGQYLRMEKRLELENNRNEIAQQLAGLEKTLGEAHPTVMRQKGQLETIEAELVGLRASPVPGGSDAFVEGRLLHRAEPVDLPSSPNVKLVLQAASVVGLLAGMLLVLLWRPRD